MPAKTIEPKEILAELSAAFPSHKLDPAAAMGDAAVTYLDFPSFETGSRGRTWGNLGWEYLKLHHDAIGFLTPAGLAEYLPAYLSAAIKHHEEVDVLPVFIAGGLTRRPDEPEELARFDDLLARLDDRQQTAVAIALAGLEALSENPFPNAPETQALDSYWRELLPKKKGK
jgi:hypothetical protein